MSKRYPEKAIQEAMTSWLREHWSFEPAFDDVEALGARFDSIGSIDGRLVLIEYKVGVSETIVRHAPDRPMSLESKIAGGLRSLYQRHGDAASNAANAVWDRRLPPLVVIAAERFSEPSIRVLETLLKERGDDWRFDWAAWRWSAGAVEELLRGSVAKRPSPEEYANLNLPQLVGRAPRASPRSLDELVALAAPEEGSLLKQFAEGARNRGYRLRSGRTKLAIAGERKARWVTVAAAYVGSSRDGLNVGIDLAQAATPELVDSLPTAKPAGFLNTNVQIGSSSDLARLFDALGPGAS